MLRILHWSDNFFPTLGGGPSHISNLIRGLSNYEHIILTNHQPMLPQKEKYTSNSVVMRYPKKIFPIKKIRIPILYPLRLLTDLHTLVSRQAYLHKEESFDIFHMHGISFYQAILKLNQITKKRIYQKIVNFSFIDAPKLITVHNFFPGFTKDTLIINAYNHYIDIFNHIICVDRHIYHYITAYCRRMGYSDKKVWFIPNSIDTSEFAYKKPTFSGKLKVGIVGRISTTIDVEMINKLLSMVPDYAEIHMAITGKIEMICNHCLKKEGIYVYRNLPYDRMPAFYHKIHVLFNPVLHDAMTRVSQEAMACGRPVIMYRGKWRGPLINGVTGIIVKRNFNEIINILRYLYTFPDKIIKMGISARRIIEREYSNEVILPMIDKIYHQLANEGSNTVQK